MGCSPGIEHEIVRHDKIQEAVTVVVDESAAGAPSGLFPPYARALRNISEGSVPIVAVKNVLAPIGDEEIVKAVVVIVSDTHSLAPPRADEPGLLRDIRECAVAVIPVEMIRWSLAAGKALQPRSVDHEEVQPAVLIVIVEGHSATGRVQDVFPGVFTAVIDLIPQAGLDGNVYKFHRHTTLKLWCKRLRSSRRERMRRGKRQERRGPHG